MDEEIRDMLRQKICLACRKHRDEHCNICLACSPDHRCERAG